MKKRPSNPAQGISRRQFNRLLTTSTLGIALGAYSSGQETAEKPSDESVEHALALIKKSRPQPLSPEAEKKVRESLRYGENLVKKLREFSLPEGSEPAFAFQPVRKGGK